MRLLIYFTFTLAVVFLGACSSDNQYAYLDNLKAEDLNRADFDRKLASIEIKSGMSYYEVETWHRKRMSVQSDPHPFDLRRVDTNDGRALMIFTMTGMKSLFNDADLDGIQFYGEFIRDDEDVFRLEYWGDRHICARGSNTTEWTTKHCP